MTDKLRNNIYKFIIFCVAMAGISAIYIWFFGQF